MADNPIGSTHALGEKNNDSLAVDDDDNNNNNDNNDSSSDDNHTLNDADANDNTVKNNDAIDVPAPDAPVDVPATPYELTGLPLTLVIAGLSMSIFLLSLDSSIVATAIPRITAEFHSTGDISWYGSAYSFAMCALQPLAGSVFMNFNMKASFFLSLGIFEVGSLLCALAFNSPMLIVGRALAGIGAAGCFTGAFCIVAVCLPLEKRAPLVGVLQSTFGIATIIGPVLGGVFTQHATWRWCFWINLPLGAVTIVTLFFFFKPPQEEQQDPSSKPHHSPLQKILGFDLLGLLAFAPAVVMLLMAVQWGGTKFAWSSATIIGLFVGGGVLAVLFMLWEWRQGDRAMIPPRLILERSMFFSCTCEFFAMGAVYISIYYLPEWFQVVKGASSTQSGVMYLPLALSDVFAAIATGMTLKFVGYPNAYIILGCALMSVGCGLLSTLGTTTGSAHWIPFQILQGLGAGMTVSMPYVATQAVLAPADIPVGTATLQCFQFFGASVLLALAQCVFQNKLVARLGALHFDEQAIQAILDAGSAGVRTVVSSDDLPSALDAYNFAITKTFYIATAVAAVGLLISLGIRWKSIKPPKEMVPGVQAEAGKAAE